MRAERGGEAIPRRLRSKLDIMESSLLRERDWRVRATLLLSLVSLR